MARMALLDCLFGYMPILQTDALSSTLLWLANGGMAQYSVGIEIEIIVQPRALEPDLVNCHNIYYRVLSNALMARDIRSEADALMGRYRKHPEHYDKWWITKDGSLQISRAKQNSLVPIEAVSPIFVLNGIDNDWIRQVNGFWDSFYDHFWLPEHSACCSSHFHVARGRHTTFTLDELKTIAFGIAVHEDAIVRILAPARQVSQYCIRNTAASVFLKEFLGCGRYSLSVVLKCTDNRKTLSFLMQGNSRNVLWNFQNTLEGKSGTIEFRGGACLRGRLRTAAWTAFIVALVHWFLAENHISRPDTCGWYSETRLYTEVREKATELKIAQHLPSRYTQLNETEAGLSDY